MLLWLGGGVPPPCGENLGPLASPKNILRLAINYKFITAIVYNHQLLLAMPINVRALLGTHQGPL